jgi:hypothetical protein
VLTVLLQHGVCTVASHLHRFVEELYTGSLIVWSLVTFTYDVFSQVPRCLRSETYALYVYRNRCIFNHMMNMHESFCLVPEGKSVTKWTCMNPFVSQRMQEACALLFNSMPQRSVMLLQVLWRSLQESVLYYSILCHKDQSCFFRYCSGHCKNLT